MTETIGQKIIGALDRAINGRPHRPASPIETGSHYIATTALPAIKSQLGGEFSDWLKGRKSLRKLQSDRDGLSEVAAAQKYDEQINEHAAHAADGHNLTEKVTRGRSREAWIADYASRQAAIDLTIQKLVSRLRPTSEKIIKILIDTLNSETAQAMLDEAKVAKKFGFAYVEGNTVQQMKLLANYLTNRGDMLIEEISNK